MTGTGRGSASDGGPPYKVKYSLWEKTDDACADRKSGHTGEQKIVEGFYNEETPIDCVNAIVYELRGVKSQWELAYVDEIQSIETGAEQ